MNNSEIRAALLKDYDWDINEENELFPFVRIVYEGTAENKNQLEKLQLLTADLNKNLKSKKINLVKFDDSKQAFWHGFGKWGIAICLGSWLLFLLLAKLFSPKELPIANKNNAYDSLSNFIEFSQKNNPKVYKLLQDEFNKARKQP